MNRIEEAPSNGTAPQPTIDTIPLPAKLVLELHAYLNERPRKETNGFATAIEREVQAAQARLMAERSAPPAEEPVDSEKAEG